MYTHTDASDQDIVPAVLRGIVGTSVPVDTPVARKVRGDALRARAVRAAVEEGEVRGDEVRAVCHPYRELRSEVVLALRYGWQEVGSRCRAVHAVGFSVDGIYGYGDVSFVF